MSKVSRTTLEKRQLVTLIGGGAAPTGNGSNTTSHSNTTRGITFAPRGGTMGADGVSAMSEDGSYLTSNPRSPADGTTGGVAVLSPNGTDAGCGCAAFAPITDAALVAFPDGSFPAFLQTACLVSYRDATAANAIRTEQQLRSAPQPTATHLDNGNATNEAAAETDGPQSPLAKVDSSGGAGSPNAHRDGTPSSPVRRETTLNPTASRPRANSQPIYVPDDAYDLEVDAAEEREASAERKQHKQRASSEATTQRETSPTVDEDPKKKQTNTKNKTLLVNEAPTDLVNEVWTAEADGTISVRNATNGRHAKGQPRIPSFGRLVSQSTVTGGSNCFVTAMVQVRNYVFAGYVDGFLRVFDVVSKELVMEKRKHAASITALAQWKDNVVFSSSDDFRIMMWKVGVEQTPDGDLKAKRAKKKEAAAAAAADGDEDHTTTTTARSLSFRGNSGSSTSPLTVPAPTGTTGPATVVNVKSSVAAAFELPSFLHQLQGHTSRIHALHVEGDYLFSGGDDGLIKCWDIRTRSEMVQKGRYPIPAHLNGGVRDITTCQTVLITAGRGGVVLYDIETCDEIKRFTGFSDVNRILVDPTSLVLWICCSSTGTVTLIDLYTFREIGVISDFSAATIKSISTVASSPASRLFLGAKGQGLSVAYCEPGVTGMRKGYTPINDATEKKYKTLDVLRDEIFANEENLESYRNLLWSIRDTDQYRKHAAARILEHGRAFQQQKQFLERCIIFVIKHRHSSRQHTIASRLEKGCEHRLRFTALLKWFLFRRNARDARFKEFVTTSLSNEHERQLIGRQLQNVMAYMAHAQKLRNRKQIAPILAEYQTRRCIVSFFIKWRRWVQEKHALEKKKLVVGYLHNRSHKAVAMSAYSKLSSFTEGCHVKNLHIGACALVERVNKYILMKKYFNEWTAHRVEKRRTLQRAAMSKLLRDYYDFPIRRKYFDLLWAFANAKKAAKATGQLAVLNDRITYMDKMIQQEGEKGRNEGDDGAAAAAAAAKEEAALDDEIARLEREIEEISRQNNTLKSNIGELSRRETALLVETGVAIADVSSHKAIPKRRSAAGEEAAEVGVSEGTPAVGETQHVTFADDAGERSSKPPAGATTSRRGSTITPKDETEVDLNTFTAFGNSASNGSNKDAGQQGANNDYEKCEAAMRSIRASAFNLRTARAEIVRRHKKPTTAAAAKADATPQAAGEAFAHAVVALFAALKPLTPAAGGGAEGSPSSPRTGGARSGSTDFAAVAASTDFSEAWKVDDGKLSAKPSAVRKALVPAHEAVVAWDYVRNRRQAASGGLFAAPLEAPPNADIFVRNINVINAIFSAALTSAASAGDEGVASPTSARSTPLQTPTNSRNASPAPSRRAATPSRTSVSRAAASPIPSTPRAGKTTKPATTAASTTRTTPSRTIGSKAASPTTGTATKRPTTAAATTTKAPSATRRSPSATATRPSTTRASSTPATKPAKAGSASPTPAAAVTRRSPSAAAGTTSAAKASTPRAGSAKATGTTAAKPKSPASATASTPRAGSTTTGTSARRSATPTGATAARGATTTKTVTNSAKAPSATSSAAATRRTTTAK